jgi:hypothetical protein
MQQIPSSSIPHCWLANATLFQMAVADLFYLEVLTATSHKLIFNFLAIQIALPLPIALLFCNLMELHTTMVQLIALPST